MSKTCTVLKVFVASPSDVSIERESLEGVVNEYNLNIGDFQDIRLELVKWETHTHPGIGSYPQDVINNQINDDYDIFLGIMWGRFGTATDRSDSGTEEEFLRAYKLVKKGTNIQIVFYFKEASLEFDQIDPIQFQKVKDFKVNLSSSFGLYYHTFKSSDEFQTKLRTQLKSIVDKWIETNTEINESNKQLKSDNNKSNESDLLANLSLVLDAELEDDIFDLIDDGLKAMDGVNSSVIEIANALDSLNKKTEKRSNELNSLKITNQKSSFKFQKTIINNSADDINVFVDLVIREIPKYNKFSSTFTSSFSRIAMLSTVDTNLSVEDVKSAIKSMDDYIATIKSTCKTLTDYQDALLQLPRGTSKFNLAKRKAIAIVKDLINQLEITINESEDIIILLKKLNIDLTG